MILRKSIQAENAVDQMEWMEKINGVIASLLSIQTLGSVRNRFLLYKMHLLFSILILIAMVVNNYMTASIS